MDNSRDPTAKILIVGDEDHLPYMRTPLSKVRQTLVSMEVTSAE